MNERDKEAVKAANNTRQPDNSTARQTQDDPSVVTMDGIIETASNGLADTIEEQIMFRAAMKVAERIGSGKFTKKSSVVLQNTVANIIARREQEVYLIEAQQRLPKYALPPAVEVSG